MKGVQCYELFGGIALKNHVFSFSFFFIYKSIKMLINNINNQDAINLTLKNTH